jgi:hypothetical protein
MQREHGGPLNPGDVSIVNESRREWWLTKNGLTPIEGGIQLFRPREAGVIIPSDNAAANIRSSNDHSRNVTIAPGAIQVMSARTASGGADTAVAILKAMAGI